MQPQRIIEIASDPSVPEFVFGSDELEEWTRKHRNLHTCECVADSGYYVVIHKSLDPARRPTLKVLSNWVRYKVMPLAWDVPQETDQAIA